MSNENNETAVVKREPTYSERFTSKILAEFGTGTGGEARVTEYQRTLVQGYFISIDRALAMAEEERQRKNAANRDHKYDNDLEISWKTVNLPQLAVDLVYFAQIGLDMRQDNMLFAIPYKNNKRQMYDITLMKGYNGIRYIAEKYALVPPKSVTIEVVHENDIFKPLKKCSSRKVESYEFDIPQPFARGEIIGGFAYLEFEEPTRNELIMMSIDDIEKRKPKYASPNFWGGKGTAWEDGKKVETEVPGWREEMVRKTLIREAYKPKHIPIDPAKIDDAYLVAKQRELDYAEIQLQDEKGAANSIVVDADGVVVDDVQAPAQIKTPEAEPAHAEEPAEEDASADDEGPDF